MSDADVQAGVTNLIRHCVAVEPGEAVLLLNERGALDPDLAALLEQAIVEAGGAPYSLWVDSLGRVEELPAPVAGAVLGADKLLLNCNLNRAVLLDHLRANDAAGLVRINNRIRAPEHDSPSLFRTVRLVMALAQTPSTKRTEQLDVPGYEPARHRGHGTCCLGERGRRRLLRAGRGDESLRARIPRRGVRAHRERGRQRRRGIRPSRDGGPRAVPQPDAAGDTRQHAQGHRVAGRTFAREPEGRPHRQHGLDEHATPAPAGRERESLRHRGRVRARFVHGGSIQGTSVPDSNQPGR